MIYVLPFFLCFFASPVAFSFWWAHLITAIFALAYIRKLSSYYLFWFLFVSILLFSSELRLSLEYFLVFSGLFSYGLSDSWQKSSYAKKLYTLLFSFILFLVIHLSKIDFYERGTMLAWLPIFLAYFFPLSIFKLENWKTKNSLTKFIVYGASLFVSLFSNKRSIIFAYLSTLKSLFSKSVLIVFSLIVIVGSFFLKDNVVRFYQKSIEPRAYIWLASFQGFADKPVFGHGFGTFTIDFPPYRIHNNKVHGAKKIEYIVHGHSQFLHTLFESGLIGFSLLLFFFYFVLRTKSDAFLPFLFTFLFNVALHSFNHILLFTLLVNSQNYDHGFSLLKKIPSVKLSKALAWFLQLTCLMIFSMSVLGHYFFDHKQYSKAIKVDSLHPLYYFSRGAKKINQDIELAKSDLKKAVELSGGVAYMHGFYAATLLATDDLENAKLHIDKSLKQMGSDPYLLVLSSFIHYDNKDLSERHLNQALEEDPDIALYLKDPSYTADEFIGAKDGNPRIMSFYRRGEKIYLPLPYIGVD